MSKTAALETWMQREIAAALQHVEVRAERHGDNRVFGYATGAKSVGHSWVTSSTAKPIMVACILSRVGAGDLSLDSLASDLIPGYLGTGAQRDVTLAHCLNFTSGISAYVPTQQTWKASTWAEYMTRVAALPSANQALTPGAYHIYSTTHLDLACAMTVEASEHETWSALFNAWRTATGMVPSATFNPGFIACAAVQLEAMKSAEMAAFWRALRGGQLLSAELTTWMLSDRIPSITERTTAHGWVGEDWHFGGCTWLETRRANWSAQDATGRVSTVGTAGQYAYSDPRHTMVVSHVGGSADPKVHLGVDLGTTLRPYLRAWERIREAGG